MESSVKIISSVGLGLVNNTPTSTCIYCREKSPNAGFPYCSDCYKLRSANQRPCCSCKKTMIACLPYSKMNRVYCSICTADYKSKKEKEKVKVPIDIPQTLCTKKIKTEEFKEYLRNTTEVLSNEEIVDVIHEILKMKEEQIKLLQKENQLLKLQVEELTNELMN